MLVAHRRQAEGVVLAGVLIVADADEGCLEQLHDGGEHLFARHAGQREVFLHATADRGQRLGEGDRVAVLGFVADFAPLVVIAVLLAPAGVAADGLQVAVGDRADPDVLPGGRDHEVLDADEGLVVLDGLAVRVEVAEGVAMLLAADAGDRGADVAQTGGLGGELRVLVELDGVVGVLNCEGSVGHDDIQCRRDGCDAEVVRGTAGLAIA